MLNQQVSNPPYSPFAQWWFDHYSFENYDQFHDALAPAFPSYLPAGNLGTNDLFTASAWENPYVGFGLAARLYFTKAGYAEPARSAYDQAVQTCMSSAYQNEQESAVAQLIIPGCFQVVIQAQSGGQAVDHVIGVQNAGGTALGAANAVLAAWKTSQGPLTQVPSLLTMVGVTATDIGSSNGDIEFVADATAGGILGAIATNAACALVQWNGGTRSRSSRGRLYHGPLAESAINNDGRTLGGGFMNGMNTAYTNFRTSLASSGYPLVVLSRKLLQPFPVTAHSIEATIATQRRRIRG